jgi:rod shape-determining protein MreD
MGSFLSLPILALAAALQASVIPHVRFWDGAPDLVFLLVLSWSIHAPLEESITWALVGGILQDLLSVAPVGLSSVGLVLIVFGVHYLARQVQRIGVLLMIGLVLAGGLFQQMTVLLLFAALGFTVNLTDDFSFVVVPSLIYNVVIWGPVYGFARLMQRRFAAPRRIEV